MNGNDYGDYDTPDGGEEEYRQSMADAAAQEIEEAWQRHYEETCCPCETELDELADGTRVCPGCHAVYTTDGELAQAHREAQAERDAEERHGMLADCGIR